MFNHRIKAVCAILLATGFTLSAEAGVTAPAPLETRAGLFAAMVDRTAVQSATLPLGQASQPPVASGTAAAATAAAQASPQAPATEQDPEKVALGTQIISNLHLVEISIAGVKIGLAQSADFQKMSEADRARLSAMIEEEILARRDIICREVAEANVGRFTREQLMIILQLSQIKFTQDLMLHGAGLAPMPDPSTMTPAEQKLMQTYGNAPYVADFFQNTDMTPLAAELQISIQNAFTRFSAPTA